MNNNNIIIFHYFYLPVSGIRVSRQNKYKYIILSVRPRNRLGYRLPVRVIAHHYYIYISYS